MGDLARINTNIAALRAYLNLEAVNRKIIITQEKIATGKIINKASDSPSAYGTTRRFSKDISIKEREEKNLELGISFLETNNSKLASVSDILLEMIDLTEQAYSGAVSSSEKSAIQNDLEGLRTEINTILNSGVNTKIYKNSGNTPKLGTIDIELSGTGASGARTTITGLSINGTNISVTGTSASTLATKNRLSSALDQILLEEEQLGTYIKRLEVQLRDVEDTNVNKKASLSVIEDADLALQQLNLTKQQIIQDSSLTMFAQANLNSETVLDLLT